MSLKEYPMLESAVRTELALHGEVDYLGKVFASVSDNDKGVVLRIVTRKVGNSAVELELVFVRKFEGETAWMDAQRLAMDLETEREWND